MAEEIKQCALNDIYYPRSPKEKVIKWTLIEVNNIYLLYYNIHGDENGFSFYAVERVSMADINKVNETDDVECVFYGVAYFDGVRHLHYGDDQTDNEGYHYYPDIGNTIALMSELKKT